MTCYRDRETICWKDLETICQLPGDEHAKLFILLTAQVEFDAVPGLKVCISFLICRLNCTDIKILEISYRVLSQKF